MRPSEHVGAAKAFDGGTLCDRLLIYPSGIFVGLFGISWQMPGNYLHLGPVHIYFVILQIMKSLVGRFRLVKFGYKLIPNFYLGFQVTISHDHAP